MRGQTRTRAVEEKDHHVRNLSIIGFSLYALAAVAACAGSDKKEETTTPEQQPAQDTSAAFPEVKFFEGDKHVLTLRSDGVVILVDKNAHVATLKPDMSLEVIGGKEARNANLAADGTITIGDQTLEAKIGPDATIQLPGGKIVTLKDDGTLEGQNEGTPHLRIEGATTPEAKRAALYLLVLTTTSATPPEAAPSAAPEATPAPTAICGDGGAITCRVEPKPCDAGQVREVVKGCYGECVDPATCKAPARADPKKKAK
jgi:hypothetical protein